MQNNDNQKTYFIYVRSTGDYIPDRSKPMEEVIADRMLLEQLFTRLRELNPEADIGCFLICILNKNFEENIFHMF